MLHNPVNKLQHLHTLVLGFVAFALTTIEKQG